MFKCNKDQIMTMDYTHCGNSVSGTVATPKYLRPLLSLLRKGNQNPVK